MLSSQEQKKQGWEIFNVSTTEPCQICNSTNTCYQVFDVAFFIGCYNPPNAPPLGWKQITEKDGATIYGNGTSELLDSLRKENCVDPEETYQEQLKRIASLTATEVTAFFRYLGGAKLFFKEQKQRIRQANGLFHKPSNLGSLPRSQPPVAKDVAKDVAKVRITATPWQIFNRVPNADQIAAGLTKIPSHWSLTPLQEKSPRRKNWQTEDFIPHETIADLILNGDDAVSQKNSKIYHRYWSGFGVRLGEASAGLLAIDVDGASAQPILEAISGGDIPPTVSWSSGKPGRYQLLFQIPERFRSKLQQCTRAVLTEWGELQTQRDVEGKPLELLEFRYNRSQSALPPSLHPSTGAYHWINSPVDSEVAVAPNWVCDLLVQLTEGERRDTEAKQRVKAQREQLIKDAAQKRQALGIIGSIDLVDCFSQSVARLSPEEIFNWHGHNFKYRGREWFGCCPQHKSQSGGSFTVNPDTFDWHCFGCRVGGGAAEYRHFVNGGRGTPKGKEFFEITKGLASQAGIELPKPPDHTTKGFTREIRRQIERSVQKLVDKLAPKPDKNGFAPKSGNDGFDDSEPDPDEYAAYVEQEQEQLKVEEAEAKARQQQFKDSYPERAKAAWRKAKRFTADIKEATQWFEADLPPDNSMFFGRAGLGRGKTTQLSKWVKQWKKQGKGFICLGYRNTLLLQLCEKLEFYHLHESDAAVIRRVPNSGIALCLDSLWRFKPEDFDGKVLILDEVMSVIRHLLHSSTVKGRDNILELFHQALQRASLVVCLDGNLADWAVKYLNQLAPEKKIITLDNTYRGEKPPVHYLLGTVVDEEVKKNDRSPWLHHLLNESQVPAICSDSQIFAESLDNLLTERGLKVLRIDSKTVPEEYIKECLKNCDAYIEQYRPDVIIYTPSAESGVDVSIKGYFTHHYGFFFGVLGVDAILQMLGRIRDIHCTKFIWVREWVAQSEQTHSKSPFTRSVGKAIEKMLTQDITDTISGIDRDQDIMTKLWSIIQQSKNPHFEASNQIQAISNYEKGNLRECVLESLEASGYKVRLCTLRPSEETREIVKEATEATKRQNCHDIFTAEKIVADFAADLSKRFDAKWEDRVKVIQATYRSRLPGIDESSSWNEDFIYKIRYLNPDFISQQELFWLFSHPEEANRMNQERYHRMAQKERTFIGNIKSRMARVRALREIGFDQFLDPEKTWMEDSTELVELVNRCKDEKIAAALGRHPGQQTNIRFLGSLLKMLGLNHKGKKVKSDDGDYRIYSLNPTTLNDVDRVTALQCLDCRWHDYLTKEVEILNWNEILYSQEVAALENQACQQGGGHSQQAKTPQAQTAQAFDPVPRTPSEYIYINEGFVEPNKSQVADEEIEAAVAPVDLVEDLIEVLNSCESPDEFATAIEGCSDEVVSDAIALADTAPQRRQLGVWYENLAAEKTSIEIAENTSERPPLDTYREGDEVWAYLPHSETKWVRATVEWVRHRLIKVKSGFLGAMIEREDAIAPGHWLLE